MSPGVCSIDRSVDLDLGSQLGPERVAASLVQGKHNLDIIQIDEARERASSWRSAGPLLRPAHEGQGRAMHV